MTLLGLDCQTTTGALTLDSILMHGEAWCLYGDLTPLWMQQRLRGGDTTVPGQPGVLPRAEVIDANEHSLELAIAGHVDQSGTPYADPWDGAVTNLQALRALLVNVTTGDGTVTASLDLLNTAGDVYAGPAKVLDIRMGRKLVTQPVWRASLELRLTDGLLELVP